MLGGSLRSLLAVDAVGTVLAGLLVVARPDWFAPAARAVPGVRSLRAAGSVRRVGVAVAGLGALKGLVYALALSRHRDGE